MAEDENMFADPSLGNGRPSRYENDLTKIPAAPEQESNEPDSWDINSPSPSRPVRDAASEYAPSEPAERFTRPEQGERPSRPIRDPDGLGRPERFERPERFNRPERDDRDGRPSFEDSFGERPERRRPERVDSYEEEYEEEEYEENDDEGKQPFRFSPRVLIPKFMELDNKKKVIVGAATVVVLIIVISIIGNIIGSIAGAISTQPAPVPVETSSTPKPSQTAEPAPVETEPSKWNPVLAVAVGEIGVTIDGAQITIDDVKCDVEAKNKNGASVEADNGSWCVANFTAKNLSDSIITISSQRFVAKDVYGEVNYIGDTRYGDVGGGNIISKLAPKESLSGFVYFDVPLGTEISSLQVSTFGNTGGSPITVEVNPIRVPPASTPTPTPTPGATNNPTPTPTPTN